VRALALIDGEHYAGVVRDTLTELPYEIVAAVLVGGTEKLRGDDAYGVPVVHELEPALAELEPEVVVDLSDEPVLGPRERFRVAARVLAAGIPYVGPDFELRPPVLEPFELPSLGIVGTGKRIGKTALSGYAARLLAQDRRVVVVAMGRGGPAEPEVVEAAPTLESLLGLSRAGRHAASDYLEDAVLAGVPTVGCRRCGGGFAGTVMSSNVAAGGERAAALDPELVIFEGSGAALPPVATAKRVLVMGADQEPEVATGYLNAFRILISDLVVLTFADPGSRQAELREAIGEVKAVPVIATILRPRPVEDVAGKRVAFFSSARGEHLERLAAHLREEHGAEVVHVSGNLARRDELRRELAAVDAEIYLVELKAAAIDVVAETAADRGIRVVFADNEVIPLPGEPDLDATLRRLADQVVREPALPT
jgi:cyclic 2,3-diphosphoglycerate synthetase